MSDELPRVVLHAATSLDGRIDGFDIDIGLFYEVAGAFAEDATLAGSETILAAPGGAIPDPDDGPVPPPDPLGTRPLLAIADGRGRVRCHGTLRAAGFWRGVVSIGCETTPRAHNETLASRGVPTLSTPGERVDLADALRQLASVYGVRTVRADSGGTLASALLAGGLVDEVSLLVHPVVSASPDARPFFRAFDSALPLSLAACEALSGGVLWVRYHPTRHVARRPALAPGPAANR